jgi:PAS domain S-box-containing protein
MKRATNTKQELLLEVKELRHRLEEAEETLRAIRSGEVDGLVVSTPEGEQVFTLSGADYPYRVLIEQMNEGAFTMATDGTILYCNSRFAEMIKKPLEKVINSSLFQLIEPENKEMVDAMIRGEGGEKARSEINLRAGSRSTVPVYFSVNFMETGDTRTICGVVTDLTEQKRSEEILKAAKLANSILDQSTEAIIICDENGKIIQTSREAHRYFPGKLLRQPFDSVSRLSIASSLPSQSKQFSISSVLSGKIIRSMEVTHSPDGAKESHFLLNARPLTHNGKAMLGCVVSLTDITERKHVEQERERLRTEAENERRRLEALMEALPVGVAITDTKGGTIQFNQAYDAVWGKPRPTALSVSDYAAYKAWWPETGKPVVPEEWASAQAVLKGQPVVGQLLEIERFDGSRASVINSGAPVFDEKGKIAGCAVAIQDITDLRNAEQALRQSEERLRRVVETSQIGIGFGDSTGRVFEANESFFRITGYSRKEILDGGIGWERLTAPEYADIDRLVMEQVSATGVAGPYEKEYIRKGGSRIPILVSAARLSTEPDEHVAFIVDLTERKQMEEELRRSRDELEIRVKQRTAELARANELLERMFSSVDISVAYMDKDFNFIRVNRAYAEADERAPEFYIGKNHFVLFPNEENEQIFRKVIEKGEPYAVYAKPFEYAEHPDRGVTYWDWSLQPVREPDGSVGGVVLSMVNVTERIRTQEAVAAERQRFNDVLEVLPAYLVLLSPDYHVPFANCFFRERFGESHGQRCFEYLFGRSEPCETCESYTALKTMLPHQWEWTGPDGRIYDVSDFPFTDTDGSTLILEMGIDITERKKAQEALRAASLYTRSLIEASLDPLVTISADGKIMDVNNATELATGVPRDELIGTDFSDYFTESERARDGYQRVFREGFVRDYPLVIRHTSGKVTDVLYHATVFRNEAGEIEGVFAAARDITVRKRMEEELRKSENRLRLLSSQLLSVQEAERKRIAREVHDSIGQTLAAIKFALESKLSQMGAGAPPPGVSIENIISLAQNGIEESRRIQMDLRPSILDDLGILATIGWFTREFQKVYSHISVKKQISVEENEIPDSLKTAIFRVMQEAMNNVAKYSKADLVRLTLRRTLDKIELSIEDNGAGFDLETIKQGLGLTSMRERTELSGGVFAVESMPGKGTTIRASWTL